MRIGTESASTNFSNSRKFGILPDDRKITGRGVRKSRNLDERGQPFSPFLHDSLAHATPKITRQELTPKFVPIRRRGEKQTKYDIGGNLPRSRVSATLPVNLLRGKGTQPQSPTG